MINKIAEKITAYYISKGTLAETDREMYVYCFELFVSTVINLFVMALVGIITELYLETALFIVGFMTMRGLAGGYHADTHLKCFLTVMLVYAIYVTCLKLVPHNVLVYIAIGFTVINAAVIPLLAPVDTEFKPLTKEEYVKNKKKCIVALAVFLATEIILLSFAASRKFGICIAYPLFITSVLLIIGILKNRKRKKDAVEATE